MTRITKAPEERRQEIIDTALKVFYEKGYEKTSISDIAREMHVAQGLCYRYFSSKEELFDTALDQYAQRQVDRISSILDPHKPLTELIRQMPIFLEIEEEDSYAQKLCHESGNTKFHNQLSLKICGKLQPIVEKLLTEAGAERRDPYRRSGDGGLLLCIWAAWDPAGSGGACPGADRTYPQIFAGSDQKFCVTCILEAVAIYFRQQSFFKSIK